MATSSETCALQPPSDKFAVIKQITNLAWLVIPRAMVPKSLDGRAPSDSEVAALRHTISLLKMSENPYSLRNEMSRLDSLQRVEELEQSVGTVVEDHKFCDDVAKSWIQLPVVTGVTLRQIIRLLRDPSAGDVVRKEDLSYILSKTYDAVENLHKHKIVHGLPTADDFVLVKSAGGVLPQIEAINFGLSEEFLEDDGLGRNKYRQANFEEMCLEEGKQLAQLFGHLISEYEARTNTKFRASGTTHETVQAVSDAYWRPETRDVSEFAMQHMRNHWHRDFKADYKLSAGLQKWIQDNIPDKLVTDAEIKTALTGMHSNK